MPPKTIEGMILDLLRALWAFVRYICVTLWSYVSEAFWAVWTYPPGGFETFRSEFVAALIRLKNYVVEHLITATAMFDLRGMILGLLRALWAFIRFICVTLWPSVSVAFWAVWTHLPFEPFRNKFVAILIGLKDYVVEHPITAMAIFILAYIVILIAFTTLLHCLGFRPQGVLRGSCAAIYQSMRFGGKVLKGSMFSLFQSLGAKGGGHPITAMVIFILACIVILIPFATLLHCLGFRRQGVLRGSYAANY